MDERTFRALVQAGAVRRVRIIAGGARFHVEADTATGTLSPQPAKAKQRPGARSMPRHAGCAVSASALRNSTSAAANRSHAGWRCDALPTWGFGCSATRGRTRADLLGINDRYDPGRRP